MNKCEYQMDSVRTDISSFMITANIHLPCQWVITNTCCLEGILSFRIKSTSNLKKIDPDDTVQSCLTEYLSSNNELLFLVKPSC